MTPHERAAARDGWFFFPFFQVWLHVFPWEIGFERPAYFDGTARDLCLMFGIET